MRAVRPARALSLASSSSLIKWHPAAAPRKQHSRLSRLMWESLATRNRERWAVRAVRPARALSLASSSSLIKWHPAAAPGRRTHTHSLPWRGLLPCGRPVPSPS